MSTSRTSHERDLEVRKLASFILDFLIANGIHYSSTQRCLGFPSDEENTRVDPVGKTHLCALIRKELQNNSTHIWSTTGKKYKQDFEDAWDLVQRACEAKLQEDVRD